MTRVLITGMSGSGKSAVTRELTARGYRAYDLDTEEWSEWIDADPSDVLTPSQGKDWVWREAPVRALLSESGDGKLFISGCAENTRHFLHMIDVVILLSASLETTMERLAARPIGCYGHTQEERAKTAVLISTVEPLLRDSADYEIDTSRPLSATVDEILRHSTPDQALRARPSTRR